MARLLQIHNVLCDYDHDDESDEERVVFACISVMFVLVVILQYFCIPFFLCSCYVCFHLSLSSLCVCDAGGVATKHASPREREREHTLSASCAHRALLLSVDAIASIVGADRSCVSLSLFTHTHLKMHNKYKPGIVCLGTHTDEPREGKKNNNNKKIKVSHAHAIFIIE